MRKEPVLTGGQKANRYMSLICTAIILILFFTVLLAWYFNVYPHWISWVEANITKKHSATPNVPIYYQDQVAVLMYHHVSPAPKSEGYVTPQRFNKDLELLKLNGFNFIPVERLAAFTEGEVDVPPNAVVITFDDGYEDVYLHAFPVLKKHQVPSIVFIIGGMIGKDGYLNWDQVRSMESSGLVTIGGHTFNQHYRVPVSPGKKMPASVGCICDPQSGYNETREEYLQRMTDDCRLLQEIFMAELGHNTAYYAYPYGAYSQDYIHLLQRSGYRYIFTVLSGSNTRKQNPTLYHRINAGTPRMPPEKLLTRLKTCGASAVVPASQPVDWSPVWDM
jgi:biofilm PGA synthesis lipoprotein PgaB